LDVLALPEKLEVAHEEQQFIQAAVIGVTQEPAALLAACS
jgi:hypothetical protein